MKHPPDLGAAQLLVARLWRMDERAAQRGGTHHLLVPYVASVLGVSESRLPKIGLYCYQGLVRSGPDHWTRERVQRVGYIKDRERFRKWAASHGLAAGVEVAEVTAALEEL